MEANTEVSLRAIQEHLIRVEAKIDKLTKLLDGSLKNNCEKMGEHIDFIERVYENVKNPLGYVCNKVRSMSGVPHLDALDAPSPDIAFIETNETFITTPKTDSGVVREDDYNSL